MLKIFTGFVAAIFAGSPAQTETLPGLGRIPYVHNLTALRATATYLYPNGVWRLTYGNGNAASPLFYRPSSSACSLITGGGDSGLQVQSVDGKCWLAEFSGTIDVREWGADPTGIADSAPALRAMFALGSNHSFVVPPGTYLIASTVTSPYPLVTGSIGFGLMCANSSPCNGITVHAYGAYFKTTAAMANIDYSAFMWVTDFHWYGGTFVANPSNWPKNSQPTGMLLFDVSHFQIQDVTAGGNWGGSTKTPTMFAADSLSYGEFDHIVMPQQGECFDVAFLQHVSFHNIRAVGAGDNGTDPSAAACISLEYDATTISKYPALVPVLTSHHIRIDNSTDMSNFDTGIFLRAGGNVEIAAYSHDNPGGGHWPIHGAGVGLYNETAVCCLSESDPVHDIVIKGAHLSNNGSLTDHSGAGLAIVASARTGAERISDILVDRTEFNNNYGKAISSIGPYIAAGTLTIGANILVAGSNQRTTYDTLTLQLQAKQNWTPTGESETAHQRGIKGFPAR